MREQVALFANAMEEMLKKNDFKGTWENDTIQWLIDKLDEELNEFVVATVNTENNPTKENKLALRNEAADAANIIMMIVDNLQSLKDSQ